MHFTHYHFQPRPRDVGGGSKKKENYAQGLGHLQKNSIYQSLLRLKNELLEKCYWKLFGSNISFEINLVGNFTMPILPVPLWLFPLIALYCVILLPYKRSTWRPSSFKMSRFCACRDNCIKVRLPMENKSHSTIVCFCLFFNLCALEQMRFLQLLLFCCCLPNCPDSLS